jgi:hypothetical protein
MVEMTEARVSVVEICRMKRKYNSNTSIIIRAKKSSKKNIVF